MSDSFAKNFQTNLIANYNGAKLKLTKQYKLQKGNILYKDFINSIGLFDLVLRSVVVHHCGEMWRRIELISKTVKKGGLIHLSIYSHTDGWGFYPDGRFGILNKHTRPKEVFDFMKERDFTLQKLKINNGLLTNNYVSKKN